MRVQGLNQTSELVWSLGPSGKMRVPVVFYASQALIADMEEEVLEQAKKVAALPGIVNACYVMPDGHWGYGFPIGGIAAFDPAAGGVISAGGVGFDIACGVRCLSTGLSAAEVSTRAVALADALFTRIPAGVGGTGLIHLDDAELDAMLRGGARWAVGRGYGVARDLEYVEEHGSVAGARPSCVSQKARHRQRNEMGTLGSGNHYLEVQRVAEVFEPAVARAFGIAEHRTLVSIHSGSRGLGHQIGTDYLREMTVAGESAPAPPDLELASAPLESKTGQNYVGAMRAAMNCALANRQVLTHLTRCVFDDLFPRARLELVYDVSHNTCTQEEHVVDGRKRVLFVHRKGATRALPPGHPELPEAFRGVGQPVLIGGSMGTESWLMVGTSDGMGLAFGSACHGAGRRMSRVRALRTWQGRQLVRELAEQRGILIRSMSMFGLAEEAPGAYKDVAGVVNVAHRAGLARKVARLEPMISVKG